MGDLIEVIRDSKGRFTQEFGRGKSGNLLLGVWNVKAKKPNTLLEIKTDGKVRIYGSLAGSHLNDSQKSALAAAVGKRPFLDDAYRKIVEGYKDKNKTYGADPQVEFRDFGADKDERRKNVLSLLEDYYGITNNDRAD